MTIPTSNWTLRAPFSNSRSACWSKPKYRSVRLLEVFYFQKKPHSRVLAQQNIHGMTEFGQMELDFTFYLYSMNINQPQTRKMILDWISAAPYGKHAPHTLETRSLSKRKINRLPSASPESEEEPEFDEPKRIKQRYFPMTCTNFKRRWAVVLSPERHPTPIHQP